MITELMVTRERVSCGVSWRLLRVTDEMLVSQIEATYVSPFSRYVLYAAAHGAPTQFVMYIPSH